MLLFLLLPFDSGANNTLFKYRFKNKKCKNGELWQSGGLVIGRQLVNKHIVKFNSFQYTQCLAVNLFSRSKH